MTIGDLHKLTGDLVAWGRHDVEVAIDLKTFMEGDNGEMIIPVESAGIKAVHCSEDDFYDVPPATENDFLVLSGGA